MNKQVRSILAQETTKTSKIRQLYLLGIPRAEIARMVTNGNYGFVVNALRRMNEREGGLNIHPATAALDYTFTRKFGIEIEAYNCSRERLARELREAGIEVMVESYNHTTRPHWKLVTDGSLNGNDTFELVSPILVGEAGLQELEKGCWVLDLCDVKVNGSCGLHVHIDAAGFSMETWRNLSLSYKHLEPVIDRFIPASRRDNYYCRGLGHVSDGMIRSARMVDELKGRIGDRYHKVDLEAYSRHKTIEFRQHSGTANSAKIANWVRFLAEFIDACKTANQSPAAPAPVVGHPSLRGVQARLADMFTSQGVVTLSAMCDAFGWQPHTARAAVTRLRRMGMRIDPVRGQSAYRLVDGMVRGAAPSARLESLWAGISENVVRFYRARAAVLAAI